MRIAHQKNEGFARLYSFSVSLSAKYGMIGLDFGKHSLNIILWSPPKKR